MVSSIGQRPSEITGNPLTEEAQWAKVRLITEVSHYTLIVLIGIDCQGGLA
jgi:hypothetical protein